MTAQAAFLGNVLSQAREFQREVLGDIKDAVAALDATVFTGADLALFTAITELLDENRVPTPAAVRTLKLPSFVGEQASAYIEQAGQLGEWKSYVEPLVRQHTRKVLVQGVTAAYEELKADRLEEARTLMSQAADEAPSWGLQRLTEITDFSLSSVVEPRIETPWPRLNEHLGGGLGFSGNGVVSLWIAASGMGKSTLAQQMIPGWLAAGHHVLYCFGEGDKSNVVHEVARLHAGLGYEELRMGRKNEIPRVLDKYDRAARALEALPGSLFIRDEEFSGQEVRDLARERRRALSKGIEAGTVPAGSQLIVIVDNIDSAITFDNKRFAREDQAYEYEAKRFEQAAKTEGYHLLILSQTNDEGTRRSGAPEMSDIARAKVLKNRAAFIVTIHRPITDADRHAQDKDGEKGRRAKTWIAVRKARGGLVAELEFETNARTGQWYDPQQSAF